MLRLTVIIPCYNASATIQTTILSLYSELNNYFDLQIVVVNDGSTDNSVEIVNEIRKKHTNIILLTKKNGGVSSARNYGYDTVKNQGGYFWFFDADDILFHGVGEKLSSILTLRSPDILRFDCVTLDASNKDTIDTKNNCNTFSTIYEGKYSDFLMDHTFASATWCLIFKNIGQRCRFNENMSIAEDELWNFDMALECAKARFTYINLKVIKYIVYNNSAINTANVETNKKHLDSLIAYFDCLTRKYTKQPHLIRSFEVYSSIIVDKMITRLLSCNLNLKSTKMYIDKITGYTEKFQQKTRIMSFFKTASSSTAMLVACQYLYRTIFLPYIKPRLSRN